MPVTQPPTVKPTFAHVPTGPVAGPLQLLPINEAAVAVHTADGAHVGSLKKVGGVWKFKAMGYGADGGMEPGHGPLTDQHNMQFATPDAVEVSSGLLGALGNTLKAAAHSGDDDRSVQLHEHPQQALNHWPQAARSSQRL